MQLLRQLINDAQAEVHWKTSGDVEVYFVLIVQTHDQATPAHTQRLFNDEQQSGIYQSECGKEQHSHNSHRIQEGNEERDRI